MSMSRTFKGEARIARRDWLRKLRGVKGQRRRLRRELRRLPEEVK